ncbi:MAG: hypothetical protein Q4G71_07085 [Pseudomonadota bacterium]|nr:hypothetical protein [Pseudomonadota bacterium]
MSTRPPFTLPLLAASAVLALLLAGAWLAPGAPARWRQWTPPAPQPPALVDVRQAELIFQPQAGAAYPQALARPLFMPTRRPAPAGPDAAASAPAPPPQPIDQARLLGIMASPALTGVLVEYDGKAQFVRTGTELGGWRLASVQDRIARFERGAERRDIELPFLDPKTGAAAPTGGARRPPARPPSPPPPPPPPRIAPSPLPAPPPQPSSPPTAAPAEAPADGAADPASEPPRASFGGGAPR